MPRRTLATRPANERCHPRSKLLEFVCNDFIVLLPQLLALERLVVKHAPMRIGVAVLPTKGETAAAYKAQQPDLLVALVATRCFPLQ